MAIRTISGLTAPARKALMSFGWPGNVRELRNVIESMIVLDVDGVLDVDDLPDDIQGTSTDAPSSMSVSDDLIGHTLEEVERHYITEALKLSQGNREEAAKMLGIGERTLYRKIKDFGLS